MKWLFISGWATPQTIFTPYASLFSNVIHYSWKFPQDKNEFDLLIGDSDYSIFCYSMGTLKALEFSQTKKPKTFISVGGFPFFCGPEAHQRKRTLLLNMMIKGLKRSPEKTIRDFHQNSCLNFEHEINDTINTDYENGLNYLKETNYSDICQTTKLDIHLIEGIQDAIVPPATSNQLMNGPGNRQTHKLKGGHGLLQNNIQEMSRLLKQIL